MKHSLPKILLLVLSISICLPLTAQLQITPLTGSCYIFTTYGKSNGQPVPANGMYITGSEGAVIIDPPWDTAQARPLLDSIFMRHGQRVLFSISTHFHDDRTGSVPVLKHLGVPTYGSIRTLQLCRERKEAEPEFAFSPDTVFIRGDIQLQVFYPGHGHAPDNIVVWIPKEKVLFGGCFIKSIDSETLGNIADADIPAWIISVRRTMHKFPHPRYIIPGHFSWQSRKALSHTLKLLLEASKKTN
jgi:metallo-beta-lactamase class B